MSQALQCLLPPLPPLVLDWLVELGLGLLLPPPPPSATTT
jgi:hypothetical protein